MELTAETLALGLVWYVVFVFSTTCHEAAHALTAYRLGDPTAYHGGQVTLSPVPHVRRAPFGMVALPLLSYLFSGWMLGFASAPYDPRWADRYPKRSALMSLAGPLSNLALALAAGLAIRLGAVAGVFYPPESASFTSVVGAHSPALAGLGTALSITLTLNLLLFIFNLIPVPPLDGSGVLPLLMPEELARRYQQLLAQQPMLGLLGLLLAWRLIDPLFGPLWGFALNLLYPGVRYG
jgi:Zn-dependent protease